MKALILEQNRAREREGKTLIFVRERRSQGEEKRRTSEFEQPSKDPCCRNFENWKVTHNFDPLGFPFLLLVWFPLMMDVLGF